LPRVRKELAEADFDARVDKVHHVEKASVINLGLNSFLSLFTYFVQKLTFDKQCILYLHSSA
jgi:hypothetical protein